MRQAALLILLLAGCGTDVGNDRPNSITVGLLPGDTPEALRARFEPLIRFVSAESGIDMELFFADSYEDLLEAFGRGDVRLAHFGGVTFVAAESRFAVVPLVMRRIDSRFTTVVVTPPGEPIADLDELRGLRVAFGSRLSTSGHVMPRLFLTDHSLDLDDFSDVTYTGSHIGTVRAVSDGSVDAGFASSFIVNEMIADGRLDLERVQISWESPPYVDYVWAIDPRIDPTLRTRIREAFLELTPGVPEHDSILSVDGGHGYVPVASSDLDAVRTAIQEAGVTLDVGEESR